ncbi:MAG: hypothetical protein FWE66_03585 [Oscillospiraceae bacterium]|nr:hypothetical protein [Oscillospiraceae bacterium]
MWFWFTLAAVLFWGTADLFYKLCSDQGDRYSHLKIAVMVGAVMGVHALLHILTNNIRYDPLNMVRYFPVSALYMLSMIIGYAGLRYIELSVSSPVGNSSGAVAFILCIIFLGSDAAALQFTAAAVVSAGIFMLSLFEKQKKSVALSETGNEKKQSGLVAFLFPVLYCVIDGLGTFADAMMLEAVMDEDQALLSYEFTFFITALAIAFYLIAVKKQRITTLWRKKHLAAGLLETAGQVFYIRAMALNAVLAAPLVACYCVVSVLLSRLFINERLTRVQYAVIVLIVVAIGILGIE